MNTDRNKKKKKVAVVTGSSSGIGLETSLLLARNGFYTYATMRNLDKSKAISNLKQKENLSLEILQLDVNDEDYIKEAIQKITNEQERIDVLVNNAGYALVGPFEELYIKEFKEQFETNVFGVIRVTQAVLPIMRRQRNGIIVNISSIAGKIGFPLTSAYVSSKFALEGLSESMAYEIEQFGIKVILIEPGVIKTNFNNNIKIGKRVAINSNSPYGGMTQKRISRFKPRFESGTPPIDVANVILKTITSAQNQQSSSDFRYLVGNDALKLMEIRNNMSDKEFRKIVIKGVL